MLYNYLHMRNWLKHEEGQDLAEYAILLALIAIVCFVAVQVLGTNISTIFSHLGSTIGSWPL